MHIQLAFSPSQVSGELLKVSQDARFRRRSIGQAFWLSRPRPKLVYASLGTRSAEHGPRPAHVATARAADPTIDAAVLVPDRKRAVLEVVAASRSVRSLGTSCAGHQHYALVALVRLRGRIRTRT